MSLIAAFAFAALFAPEGQAAPKQATPPSNHQVIAPNPNAATRTMDRFADNERNLWIQDVRRRLSQAEHNERVYEHRMALADRLDQLIGQGRCGDAQAQADNTPHKDIAGEVTRICNARTGR